MTYGHVGLGIILFINKEYLYTLFAKITNNVFLHSQSLRRRKTFYIISNGERIRHFLKEKKK